MKGYWKPHKSNHSGLDSESKGKSKSEVAPNSLKITLFTVWSNVAVVNSAIHRGAR